MHVTACMKTSLQFVSGDCSVVSADRKCASLTPCDILPFTRREFRPMEQVSFQDNGTKVAAVNTKTYIFQRNMSRGPESDLIRTINVPAMVSTRTAATSLPPRSDPGFPANSLSASLWACLQTVMTMFKDQSFLAGLISSYMRSLNEGLFATRSVGELLWGYEDGLLKALKTMEPSLDTVFGLFYKVKTIEMILIVICDNVLMC